MTNNPQVLQQILNRLQSGNQLNRQELETLAAAVRAKQVELRTGDRSVSVGGNADRAVIITGDRNIFINNADANILRDLVSPRQREEKILLNTVRYEVTARLDQSLHKNIFIELGMELRPEQVERPWSYDVKIGEKLDVKLSNSRNILEIFDNSAIAGKLLILGNPGAGKTTTMLNLAQALLERAEQQSDYPIPVIFNLSSWKSDEQGLQDWLELEMKTKYGIRRETSKKFLENKQLLPMLDGLDELRSDRQQDCVLRINTWIKGESGSFHVIVCSRDEEYQNYNEKLKLNGSICIKKLTDREIVDYLVKLEQQVLLEVLRQNRLLWDLARVPFWLNIMILVTQELETETRASRTKEIELHELLDAYVKRMLTRKSRTNFYHETKVPNHEQTLKWLSSLARQMKIHSETEFLIEEMQINWLTYNQINRLYTPFLILLLGSTLAILLAVLLKLVMLIFWGTSSIALIGSGALLGLIIGFGIQFESRIQSVETLDWSWEASRVAFIRGVNEGLSFAQKASGIRSRYYDGYASEELIRQKIDVLLHHQGLMSFFNLIVGLSYGVLRGIFLGCVCGWTNSSKFENKQIPNQGILKSKENFINTIIIVTLIALLVSVFIWGTIFTSEQGRIWGAMLGICFGLLAGFALGLDKGGKACIQHLSLRLTLFLDGRIPWNYARFLDYCTERLFLQRVGGRYRFIHRLLQEHFAAMPLEHFRSDR